MPRSEANQKQDVLQGELKHWMRRMFKLVSTIDCDSIAFFFCQSATVVINQPMAGKWSSKRAREPGSITKQPNLERQKKGPAASSTTGPSTNEKDKRTAGTCLSH